MLNKYWGLGHYFFDINSLLNGDLESFGNLKVANIYVVLPGVEPGLF